MVKLNALLISFFRDDDKICAKEQENLLCDVNALMFHFSCLSKYTVINDMI